MKRISQWLALSLVPMGLGVSGCASLGDLTAKKDSKPQISVARIYESQGKTGQATRHYQDVLKRDKNSIEAHQRLAIIAAKRDDHKQAHEHFQAALQISPDNPKVLADYGYYLYTQDDLNAAEKYTRQALEFEPNDLRVKNNLGLILGRQGNHNEAFAVFKSTVGEAKAHANLAYVYSQCGELDKAKQHYSQALSLDAEFRPATQALVKLHERDQQINAVAQQRINAQKFAQNGAAGNRPGKPGHAVPSGVVTADATGPVVSGKNRSRKAGGDDLVEVVADRSKPETLPTLDDVNLAAGGANSPAPAATDAARNTQLASAERPTMPKLSTGTALSAMCAEASGEVAELLKIMDGDDPLARKIAVSRLGRMGAAAKSATPACNALLQDRDPYVRVHAGLALWRINKQAGAALPVLTAALKLDDNGLRSLAASSLGEMGGAAREALPALTAALNDTDPQIRIYVAEACCKIERNYDPALRVLIEGLRSDDASNRELSIYALGNIAPDNNTVIRSLALALQDSESRVRAATAFAIGEIGPAAAETVPELKKALDDAHHDVRTAASLALKRIDPNLASLAP